MRYLLRPSTKHSDHQSLDLIPLIDVVFILLIFFSVSTTLKTDHGLPLNLPTASHRPHPASPLTIYVDARNQLSINDIPLSPTQFQAQLAAFIQAQPNHPIVIRADNQLQYQAVITVIDWVHKAGGTHAVLATTHRYETP